MVLCICPNPSVDKYIWVDNFKERESNRAVKEKNYPGGKGVHVAMALKEMGADTCLLGFWGGPTGQWIKEQCSTHGIECYGPETEEWTRTCITFKSDENFGDTELLGVGPQITGLQFEEFLKTFTKLVPESRCVTMSGSWPANVPDYSYATIIDIANQFGKKTFLDCSGIQLKNALLKNPYTIHINRRESLALNMGNDPAEISTALSNYCKYVAITAGAEGLFLFGNNREIHSKCEITKVYSAVGSGDCLLAGLAYAYLKKMNMQDAAAMGVACGAANCLREDLGMLYRSDVEALLPKIFSKIF